MFTIIIIGDHLVTVGNAGQTQELHSPLMQLLDLELGAKQNWGCASKS